VRALYTWCVRRVVFGAEESVAIEGRGVTLVFKLQRKNKIL